MCVTSWLRRLGELMLRLLLAILLGGIAALLGWVVVMVLISPSRGAHPVSLFALRAFMLLMVGPMALSFGAGALWAVGLWPSGDGQPDPVPGALLRFCPGCGGLTQGDAACGSCGLALSRRAGLWARRSDGRVGDLLGAPIMLSIASLGLFLLSEAIVGDESTGMRVASALLSLLLLLVGGVGTVGMALHARDMLRQRGAFFYSETTHEGGAVRTIQAEARVLGGRARGAKGSSVWLVPLPEREAEPRPDLSAGERNLVRLMASLLRAGHINVYTQRTLRWSGHATRVRWGDDRDPYRSQPGDEAPTVETLPALQLEVFTDEETASGPESEAIEWICDQPEHHSADALLACVRSGAGAARRLSELDLLEQLRPADDPSLDADEAALAARLVPPAQGLATRPPLQPGTLLG